MEVINRAKDSRLLDERMNEKASPYGAAFPAISFSINISPGVAACNGNVRALLKRL